MAKYLLILGSSVQCGIHTAELTREVEIDCEPSELKYKIENEKSSYNIEQQSRSRRIDSDSDVDCSEMIVTVSVKQVLPL